jgi:hypothetical protein
MSHKLRRSHLVLASCLMLGVALPACGKSQTKDKASSKREVKVKVGGAAAPNAVGANIAEFDPNADISLDMDKYGTERPDEYQVQQAFFGQFGAIDECVWAEKDRRGSERQLPGDVALSVKLNPEQSRPFGVNATMPDGLSKAEKLANCLREAAASAPYPTYDGPPVVVDFEMELDPGYVDE